MKAAATLFAVSLAAAILCGADNRASAQAVDISQFKDAAQDGAGLVWAGSNDGKLAVHEGGAWHAVPLPDELRGMKFLRMQTAPDGQVLMLWQREKGVGLLTQNKGSMPRARASIPVTAELRNPTIFCDSQGDIWIASGLVIYRVRGGSNVAELAYTIPGEFYDQLVTGEFETSHLRAFEDARHRLWFFSEPRFRGPEPAMRGVVICEGNTWRTMFLNDLPGNRFSFVGKKDDDHFWIGVHHGGLFTLDASTLKVQPVAEPEPHAFLNIRGIHRVDDSNLMVTEANVANRVQAVLWRERAGDWKKLVTGLDLDLPTESERDRALLQTPAGLLLGGFGTGMWLLRQDDEVRIDWRSRFPLHSVHRLFNLPHGQFLAVGFGNVRTFIGLADKPPLPPGGGLRVTTVSAQWAPVADARGHLWVVRPERTDALAEWDGDDWRFHERPPSLRPLHQKLAVDSAQRIWAFIGQIGLFDPSTSRWEKFDDYRTALQAQLGSGRRLDGSPYPTFFSGDGRVVFTDIPSGAVDYFDGRKWRQWRRGEIGASGAFPETAAFFTGDNVLTCKMRDGFWQFAEETGWKRSKAGVPIPETAVIENQRRELPSAIAAMQPESSAWDANGICWFTKQGVLRKGAFGKTVPVFEADEPQPFIDGRQLWRDPALIDARGHAVLHSSAPAEMVIISPRHPPPETVARLVDLREGTATIELSSADHPALWWRWRRDGGAWSSPITTKSLTIDFEENGSHLVEVVAVDDELQVDPTPARVAVNVQVDWRSLIVPEIDRLRSEDQDQRNAAVAALARRGKLALPLLREAKGRVSDRERWWIEVAIQEIERAQR